MAGTTPSQGIPYAERPDPFELTADLRGSFNKIDSVFAQTRGESTAALTAAQVAEVKAAQALLRALAIEDPVHVGPEAPTDGETLWVDTDADPTPTPVGDVTSADIVDASTVGRAVLTAPLSVDARNALSIFTGTRALLDAGTDTAERTWDAKELAEYVTETAENAGGAASWDDLTGKPTTFPSTIPEVDGLQSALDEAAGAASWDDLAGKPSTFPPAAHNHDDRYYTEAEVDAKIEAAMTAPGTMSNPVDLGTAHLDTITTPGHYTQRFKSRPTKANGYPYEGAAGVLEVLAWHPTGIIQRWTSQEGGVATRYVLNGNWQVWQNAMAESITG